MDIDSAPQETQASSSRDGDLDNTGTLEQVPTSVIPHNNDGLVETTDLPSPSYAIPLSPTHHTTSPHLFLYQDNSSQAETQQIYGHIGLPFPENIVDDAVPSTSAKNHQTDPNIAKSSCTSPKEDNTKFPHSSIETTDELLEAGGCETLHKEHAQTPRGKVQRVFQACLHCKRRKSKCDGQRPSCSSCVKLNIPCEWASERRMRGPNKNKKTAGESRPRKSRVHVPPEADEDPPPSSPPVEAFGTQSTSPILIGGSYPHIPPPYDLATLHHGIQPHTYSPEAHLLDPAVYQVHAQMLMNAHINNGGQVGISDVQSPFHALGDAMNSAQEGNGMVRVVSVSDISMHNIHESQSHLTSQADSLTSSLADVKNQLKSPIKSHRFPSPTVTPEPYVLPDIVQQHPDEFHNGHQFGELVDNYLKSLNRKTSEKALITQSTYDAVVAHLHDQDPPASSVEAEPAVKTALFKFWARKSFALKMQDGREIVTHNAKPVAVREQLYDILVTCHALSKHGGRDKTCGLINERYSWVPKSFVDAFVRSCPGCPRKRRTVGLNHYDPIIVTSADSDSFPSSSFNRTRDNEVPDGLITTDWHMGEQSEGVNVDGGERQETGHLMHNGLVPSQQSSSVPSSPLEPSSPSATINDGKKTRSSSGITAKSVIKGRVTANKKKLHQTGGQNKNATASEDNDSSDDVEHMDSAPTS